VPTLYVWSTNDIAPGEVAARATTGPVGGPYRFELMDGASHWIPETRIDELSALALDHVHTRAASRLS
jgi:pimeloyl-ACP methyl ester carboxylesterase